MERDEYIALVEDEYFAGMAEGRPERSMALFSDDGWVTARAAGLPPRVARRTPGPGEETLHDFFTVILQTYAVSYSDFWHTVDVEAQRHCAIYTVRLRPLDQALGLPVRELRNANFFQFDGRAVRHVVVVGLGAPSQPTCSDSWSS